MTTARIEQAPDLVLNARLARPPVILPDDALRFLKNLDVAKDPICWRCVCLLNPDLFAKV